MRYLKIKDLPNGTAETVENALVSACQEADIPLTKVMGFGSDGASVMVGSKTGVAVRLKRHNAAMISVHCVSHRLALASAQAADSVPYLEKFKNHLTQIFRYYHYSSVCSASLISMQTLLDDPVLKLKAASNTRWLPHDQAVSTIWKILSSLVAHMEQEAETKGDVVALGLISAIKTFVASIYLFSDILPHLSALSCLFQERDIDYSQITTHVFNTISVIENLKMHDGPNMRKLPSIFKELAECCILVKDKDEDTFRKNVREAYIDSVVVNLRCRFPDVKIIPAFSLFDPRQVPESSTDQFQTYGEQQLRVLEEHFGRGYLDHSLLEQDWIYLKQLLVEGFDNHSTREVMETILTDSSLATILPQMHELARIALSTPVSTAEYERGFSSVKRIKTELRNRLKTETLDFLLRISTEGPDIEKFDFEKAAAL